MSPRSFCERHHRELVSGEFLGRKITYCPQCVEEEQQRKGTQEAMEIERDRELARQKQLAERFEAIRIGKRFSGMNWEDYQPPVPEARVILGYCRGYARNFNAALTRGTSLILLGKPGTGKNMLAALIARDVVAQGHSALHTTAAKLIRKIRSTWQDRSQDEQEVMDSFSKPDLLILDEVGVQAGSETEERLLTEVINDRYEAVKPTICISNLSVKGLEDYLGFRVLDRFHENGGRVLEFTWESWRRK